MLEDAVTVTCPHCWESITLVIDLSVPEQTYTEDCAVCCAPMLVTAIVADGVLVDVSVKRD